MKAKQFLEKLASNKMTKMLNAGKITREGYEKLLNHIPEAGGLAAVNRAGHNNAREVSKMRRTYGKDMINVHNTGVDGRAEDMLGQTHQKWVHDLKDKDTQVDVYLPGKHSSIKGSDGGYKNMNKELRGYIAHHEISGEMPRGMDIIDGIRETGVIPKHEIVNMFGMSSHYSPDVLLNDSNLSKNLSPLANTQISGGLREKRSRLFDENDVSENGAMNLLSGKTGDDFHKDYFNHNFSDKERKSIIGGPYVHRIKSSGSDITDQDRKIVKSVAEKMMKRKFPNYDPKFKEGR